MALQGAERGLEVSVGGGGPKGCGERTAGYLGGLQGVERGRQGDKKA